MNVNYRCTLLTKLALALADNVAVAQLHPLQIWSLLAKKQNKDGDGRNGKLEVSKQ